MFKVGSGLVSFLTEGQKSKGSSKKQAQRLRRVSPCFSYNLHYSFKNNRIFACTSEAIIKTINLIILKNLLTFIKYKLFIMYAINKKFYVICILHYVQLMYHLSHILGYWKGYFVLK
ncbi:hypothetical protein AM263_17315 [Escherichia coli]|nr:hypothetical protein AB190_21890 [Enterobacter asburiae]KQI94974.1 hypothetical protein AM263_17315 [Escherichia coli]RHW60298.1 hypothetical protein DOX38_04735 [Cronobacter sakazakii]